jgi:L-serine dehydratase
MLFYKDRPGMIHQVTEIIAAEGINIASLSCSRKERGKDAFMQIDVDSPLSMSALRRIMALGDMDDARYLDRIP